MRFLFLALTAASVASAISRASCSVIPQVSAYEYATSRGISWFTMYCMTLTF